MDSFIITPIAGAIIGYFTNWLAIKMLFRPHEAKYVFGIRLPFTPGLMPKERHRLAGKIGETLAAHVITTDMIRTGALSDENMRMVEHGIREFLKDTKAPTARVIAQRLDELHTRLAEEGRGVLAYLPEETIAVAERLLYENIPRFTELLRHMPPEISDRLIGLTGRIIDEAVGKIAGIFINRARVYDGIINSLCEYLDDETNRADTAKRLGGALSNFLENDARLENIPWNPEFVEDITVRVTDVVFDKAADAFLQSETVRAGIAHALSRAVSNMDLRKMAEDRLNSMDIAEAERIVISVVKRELQAITVVGGVLGFVIGLVPGLLRLL